MEIARMGHRSGGIRRHKTEDQKVVLSFYWSSRCVHNMTVMHKVRKKRVLIETKSDPWALYLYTIKSPPTKEKYSLRLRKFLDFIDHNIRWTLHCSVFIEI